MQIIFKNLERSELARQAAEERLQPVFERFHETAGKNVLVTLGRENSRLQPGPDLFTVKVFFSAGRYRGVVLERSAPNLYVALADVADRLLERLNRHGDRERVRMRAQARAL